MSKGEADVSFPSSFPSIFLHSFFPLSLTFYSVPFSLPFPQKTSALLHHTSLSPHPIPIQTVPSHPSSSIPPKADPHSLHR